MKLTTKTDHLAALLQELGVHSQDVGGYQEVSLYCPYWMVNKSGRNLAYKVGGQMCVINHMPLITWTKYTTENRNDRNYNNKDRNLINQIHLSKNAVGHVM